MDAVEMMQMDVESESELASNPSIEEAVQNVTTDVTLDLESYMCAYEGYTRYLRLAYVARHCPTLVVEAVRHAIRYVYTETEDYHNYILLHLWLLRLQRDPSANVDDILQESNRRPSHAHVLFMEHPRSHVLENMLQEVHSLSASLEAVAGNENVKFDAAWVQNVRTSVGGRIEELENEMKLALGSHPGSLGKKNTRIPALKLAQLFTRCGELYQAIRCYTQAVEQCSTAQEEIDILLKLLYVSVCHSNWMCVDTYINRLESRDEMQEFVQQLQRLTAAATSTSGAAMPVSNSAMVSILPSRLARAPPPAGRRRGSGNENSGSGGTGGTQGHQTSLMEKEHVARAGMRMLAVTALSELHLRKYKAAAKSFFQIRYELFEFRELLSLSNVAQYAALCALATFDRVELKRVVFENSVAKQVLEADPDVRDVLQCFYQAQYGLALNKLHAIQNNLRVDIYLAPHMDTLVKDIRTKAICQYFSPYLSCELTKTAAEFHMGVQALEDEVAQMVLDGTVDARIDSQCKVLYARSVDQRKATYSSVLTLVEQYSRTIHAFLMRNALKRRMINFTEDVFIDDSRKPPTGAP